MSGGAFEYTMSNIVNTDESTMIPRDSGYTTTTYPDAKYYDKYSYSTSVTSRKRSKLGDGIKEVYKSSDNCWYSDFSYLANSSFPYLHRGGHAGNGLPAGVFDSNYESGSFALDKTSRLIITP